MPYYRLFYHFIWSTKDRLPLITEHNRDAILAGIRAKVKQLNGIVHAVNAVSDHVHLVATVPPAMGLAQFIGQVKGNTSHLAAHLDQGSAFQWQAEYGVLSVSESHLPFVVQYVLDQARHHGDHSLVEKLECQG